jgi:Tol biopolymer transport system component
MRREKTCRRWSLRGFTGESRCGLFRKGREGVLAVRRLTALATVAIMTLLGLATIGLPAGAKVPGQNGQIAFARFDPTLKDFTILTVNPDGSHEEDLFSEPSCCIHWSPDGTEVAIIAEPCPGGGSCGGLIVNADTGSFREIPEPAPEPTLFNDFFGCGAWSQDSTRLACEAWGDTPGVTGIYTIRSSDGGDLTRITTAPVGGTDAPFDYSPDGKFLVFGRSAMGEEQGLLFVVKLNGSGLQQITPSGMVVGGSQWSPSGNKILFPAQIDSEHRRAIFMVNSDGSGLHQVPILGCGGAFSDVRSIGCADPTWSPDGTKIAFVRRSAGAHVENIYTVNADGSGLTQVTHDSGGLDVCCTDWGPHRPAT